MGVDARWPEKTIHVEVFKDDAAECHSCGKIGKPRFLIHFAHLCQHFVALCGRCWKKLEDEMHYSARIR